MPARPNIATQYNQIDHASPEKEQSQHNAIANLGEASFQLPRRLAPQLSTIRCSKSLQEPAMNLEEIPRPVFNC
jgi:hypothetical protein